MKRFLLGILLILVLAATPASAATKIYGCTALTGGGSGALDAIDGASLADKDMAVCVVSGISYTYYLSASSGATEASPTVISPNTNAGLKRWILAAMPPAYGGATASVADGGKISHGLGVVPSWVVVTSTVSGEWASVTSLDSDSDGTKFTVAIKKADGSAGTTQTIYWQAGR